MRFALHAAAGRCFELCSLVGPSQLVTRRLFLVRGVPIFDPCGPVVQSSGPLRYAIVDGLNVRDSRVSNYPPRWNAAPSQELLVIRRNRETDQVSLDPLRWG